MYMNNSPVLKPNILLADDDPAIRVLLGEFLALGGFSATAVVNGEEALSHCRASRPDLVITDIDMPLMNGLEFIRQIRADGDTTPIIAISGDAAHLIAAENLGAQDSFVKPLIFELFMKAVNEHVS